MPDTHLRRPRRSFITLMIIVLGLFAAVPSATANAEDHDRQHFLLVSSDPAENATLIVVATGPIHAKGTDTVVSETEDTFTFPDGTLSVTHTVNEDSVEDTVDAVTCYFTHTERGTYTVTGGTGAYADAHGDGHYSVRASGVGCDENAPLEFFSLKIKAAGPLDF
jgi:hypothetical protein